TSSPPRVLCLRALSFFFNAPPTTAIYPLSLHDALPILTKLPQPWAGISSGAASPPRRYAPSYSPAPRRRPAVVAADGARSPTDRSEEHTSELQSLTNLVCRLLLEKKKQ